MAIVVTVKMRPRYTVRATPDKGGADAEIFDRVSGYRKARRGHQVSYSVLDWVHTAEYLSDRVAGYPVPPSLLNLRKLHNEDRRRSRSRSTPGDSARTSSRVIVDDPHVKPVVNTRLALLASMARSFDTFPASAGDWARFKPPSAPPMLQKPNRKARRAVVAQKRRTKG